MGNEMENGMNVCVCGYVFVCVCVYDRPITKTKTKKIHIQMASIFLVSLKKKNEW